MFYSVSWLYIIGEEKRANSVATYGKARVHRQGRLQVGRLFDCVELRKSADYKRI